MVTVQFTAEPFLSKRDVYTIVPIGDIHLGNRGCDEAELLRWVQYIAETPKCYTILMGDLADLILPDDKRWDHREVADWLYTPENRGQIALAQYDRLYEIFSKIPSHKIIGVIEGNHEFVIKQRHYVDLALDLARNLKTKYLTDCAFIAFKIPYAKRKQDSSYDRRVVIFAAHGYGAARKVGGKINKVTDLAHYIDADLYLMGHVHMASAVRDSRLSISKTGRGVIGRDRVFATTGTFLRTYQEGTSGYAARVLYPATAIGPQIIRLNARDGSISTAMEM